MESKKPLAVVIVFSAIIFLTGLGFVGVSVSAAHPPLQTQIIGLNSSASGTNTLIITGQIDYFQGGLHPLDGTSVMIDLYWATSPSGAPDPSQIIASVPTATTGQFSYPWIFLAPIPGTYIVAKYVGGDIYNISSTLYNLTASSAYTISMQLTVMLASSAVAITPGNSASVAVSVSTTNSGNAQSVSLLTLPGACSLGLTCSFSPASGSVSNSVPLSSQLTISVPSSAVIGTAYNLYVQAQWQGILSAQQQLTVTVRALTQVTVNTLVSGLDAQYDGQNLYVTGIIQYQYPGDNSYRGLPNAQVQIGNPQQGFGAPTWLGKSNPSDQNGDFSFIWPITLDPAAYSMQVLFTGSSVSYSDSTYQYTFYNYNTTVPLYYALAVNVALDSSTVTTVPNGPTNTVTISVTTNSQTSYTITLSVSDASGALDVKQLSATSGTASATSTLTSKLVMHVSNSTKPGTYKITVTASTQQGSYPVSSSRQLTVVVQKNTRSLVITIQGLPSNVQTSLLVGGSTSYTLTSSTKTITVPNSTQTIQVTQEIDTTSGDTRYLCSNFQQSTTDPTVSTFTFTYVTQYRLKITAASLPAVKGVKLVLIVNGANISQDFNPSSGYSDFYAVNTVVGFNLAPSYIATSDVDYNFTGWTDASGKSLSAPFVVTMNKPYAISASFSQWVHVTIVTDLPNNISSTVQISTRDGGTRAVNVIGGVPFQAGLFPIDSTFQSAVSQNQTTLYGGGGSVRYTYQAIVPSSSLTLNKHTTIVIHYQTEYKVQVYSQFANTILQPSGGTEWVPAGGNATLQVKSDARDTNWIPYVFSGWTGLPQSSNQTTVSFTVAGPLQVGVQWKPNWTYILVFAGVISGISVPASLIGRRKIRTLRENREVKKKEVPNADDVLDSPKNQLDDLPKKPPDADIKLYNYIIEKGGSIRLPDAMKELNMSREEITESIRRLKETKLLH